MSALNHPLGQPPSLVSSRDSRWIGKGNGQFTKLQRHVLCKIRGAGDGADLPQFRRPEPLLVTFCSWASGLNSVPLPTGGEKHLSAPPFPSSLSPPHFLANIKYVRGLKYLCARHTKYFRHLLQGASSLIEEPAASAMKTCR